MCVFQVPAVDKQKKNLEISHIRFEEENKKKKFNEKKCNYSR